MTKTSRRREVPTLRVLAEEHEVVAFFSSDEG
jgi:hypothetical protein